MCIVCTTAAVTQGGFNAYVQQLSPASAFLVTKSLHEKCSEYTREPLCTCCRRKVVDSSESSSEIIQARFRTWSDGNLHGQNEYLMRQALVSILINSYNYYIYGSRCAVMPRWLGSSRFDFFLFLGPRSIGS
jgi:hypothetical protein